MADDAEMTDGNPPATQATTKSLTEQELEEQYPNKPYNRAPTLPFHDLFLTLFNPLRDNRKKPTGPALARKKVGPHGPHAQNPNEVRHSIVERFISRWRKDVGNDIHPALRLIIPDKDRERAMYGLKEAAIAKLLIRCMKIDRDSEDGFNLRNWKSAGVKSGSAGDFAARCYEVLAKRPLRTEVGDLTIAEVNEMLDRLSIAQKEEQQFPILKDFYQRMNPEEMMWLIRIILRQMKIGATEKTILDIWHPDAETLFNVSSNLRRVCWELWDPHQRLQQDKSDISLMSCFQPQLAQFQMHSFEKMVQKMRPTEDDKVFWVEEKLDGERMQLHMQSDPGHPGGKRFCFWSRKAKDYTHLYGNGLEDDNSALTRHLKHALDEGVENIILDGEMITWNMKLDRIVGFGTLKTAALEQQRNPMSDGDRPLYRVFDILYLNNKSLTLYTMRDRRNALTAAVKGEFRRMELHDYTEAKSAADIEPLLRTVVSEASEGLVVKNPRSSYHLNERNDDWIKVKPEYMTGYGSEFDCIVIGGYYGSGRRGGFLSSFLCGLTPAKHKLDRGINPQHCMSFFKVGGGFSASDYQEVRHKTEGKWHKFDPKKPPIDWIELGGKGRQFERPDEWIKPEDSFVVTVKAASIHRTDQFAIEATLRFPRFVKIRNDKDWKTAMTEDEFEEVKYNIEHESQEKKFEYAQRRKKTRTTTKKVPMIAGQDDASVAEVQFAPGSSTDVFKGLTLCVLTAALKPGTKKELHTKPQLENLARHHGAKLTQSATSSENVIVIADRESVTVSGLKKQGTTTIIRPSWVLDCIHQSEIDIQLARTPLLLPYEPRHVLYAKEGDEDLLNTGANVVSGGVGFAADVYGDGFAKDVESVEEMRKLLEGMPSKFEDGGDFDADDFLAELDSRDNDMDLDPGLFKGLFHRYVVHFDNRGLHDDFAVTLAANIVRFAGGQVAMSLEEKGLTTIVVDDRSRARELRKETAGMPKLPHIVTLDWIGESWEAGTILDEERFVPHG